MKALTVGSLFSGIGGLELGLEMTGGFQTAWQVEINEYAGRVLKKHWPDVPLYRDVREVGGQNLEPVDLICGGFPCQPHSLAGARKAEEDERDLWDEFARIVRELRPRWVLAENVPGLLSSRLGGRRGGFFGKVLADLAEIGYDAEWDCIPASALGAHHQRDRVFLVAYPNGERGGTAWTDRAQNGQPVSPVGGCEVLAYTDGERRHRGRALGQKDGSAESQDSREAVAVADTDGARELQPEGGEQGKRGWAGDRREAEPAAHARGCRCQQGQPEVHAWQSHAARRSPALADPDRQSLAVGPSVFRNVGPELQAIKRGSSTGTGLWATEPDVGRVAHGVPKRVDRLRGLGNAVVPLEGYLLGQLILAVEAI